MTRRDFLKLALGAAAWAVVKPVVGPTLAAAPTTSLFEKADRALPYVALTLDDMWDYGMLAEFEAFLAERPHIRVTFFPVGRAVMAATAVDPDIWKRLARQGHEIGYHTHDHRRPDQVSDEEYALDWQYWRYAVQQALGYMPLVRFGRPPFGILSGSFYRLCAEQGLMIAMWSRSWPRRLPEDHPALTGIKQGDVVLLHGNNFDLENLQAALPVVAAEGWTAVTLTHLHALHHNQPFGQRRSRLRRARRRQLYSLPRLGRGAKRPFAPSKIKNAPPPLTKNCLPCRQTPFPPTERHNE